MWFFVHCSCFINHIGVFFGAFLGPIFLIILFNLVIFIIVITVLVRHNISRNKRQMKDSKTQIETCKLILSLSGIMTLLGLTWVLSVFTSVGASTQSRCLVCTAILVCITSTCHHLDCVLSKHVQKFYLSVSWTSVLDVDLWLFIVSSCIRILSSCSVEQLEYWDCEFLLASE